MNLIITKVDANTISLDGSTFANAYTRGCTVRYLRTWPNGVTIYPPNGITSYLPLRLEWSPTAITGALIEHKDA